jgi:excisionase family DNA binding protein
MPIELKDYLNQSAAAEFLKVSRMTIWRWMEEGNITYVIIGGFRMIPRSEVERIAEENKQAVSDELTA